MAADIKDHAHEVVIVAPRVRASRTQAHNLQLGRRLPRDPVPEDAAVVKPVARPARLADREPVVAAVPADIVRCEAHSSACPPLLLSCRLLSCSFSFSERRLSFRGMSPFLKTRYIVGMWEQVNWIDGLDQQCHKVPLILGGTTRMRSSYSICRSACAGLPWADEGREGSSSTGVIRGVVGISRWI